MFSQSTIFIVIHFKIFLIYTMKVQDIRLTEGEILRRFSVMEAKFPRREGKNYFPSLDFYLNYFDNKEESIRQEADRMIEFVGLGTYRSNVKFLKLEGVAGNILLNSDMVAQITIDEDIANNIDAVMATLAHEICHKVLFKYGIYFKTFMKEENEVYADLATFYIGFGDLTMKGYKVGNNLAGYLSPDTYAMAYVLMTVINQKVDYNINGLPQHARAEIDKAKRKCGLIKTNFRELCKDNYNQMYSETFSEIRKMYEYYDLLLAALPGIQNSVSFLTKGISDAFYNYDIKDLEWHKFSIAFNAFIFTRPNDDNIILLQKLQDHFSSAFFSIYRVLNIDNNLSILNKIERHCPNCGSTINKELEPREYHLVCPKCKTHFVIDGDLGRILTEVRELDQKYNKKECDAILENSRLKMEIERLTDEVEMYKSIAEDNKHSEVNNAKSEDKLKDEELNEEGSVSFVKKFQRKLWNNNKKAGHVLYDKNGKVIKENF